MLKDYRPVPIHNLPITKISKAKFPVIDMHSHTYANTEEEIKAWISTMNEKGITKTILLTFSTGARFDSLYTMYSKYEQFELWCGIDFTNYNLPNWSQSAIEELERCFKLGARGVGEMGDKGEGLVYSKPTPAYGMHIDDPRMQPIIQKCGELGMPINIHVAEPYWMYEPINNHNDGLMNAAKWPIDQSKPDILLHNELIFTLENAVKQNPNTTFIACHYANCSYDLSIIGSLLTKYPNLYVDISARYAETSVVPRYTKAFIEKNQNKLLYGTDMGFNPAMYEITFRILESADEHFYEIDLFNYHWDLNGLNLSNKALKKLYYENAKKILD
ncbi:amidohydrolase family protein [Reichenbachiella faecimaris]|uniref:amidohydrolase family protein n=1 Tax=Reichenbachiella faecimaris TaxID=692418 RepID=UPI001C876BB3|nr:amidohydrolase family protein [Reichenbachiella faecimaris]